MEILAIILFAAGVASALLTARKTDHAAQHRTGAAVAEIEARLRREQTRTFVPLRGW